MWRCLLTEEHRLPRTQKGYIKIPYNIIEIVRTIGSMWEPLREIRRTGLKDLVVDVLDQTCRDIAFNVTCGQMLWKVYHIFGFLTSVDFGSWATSGGTC